MMRRLLRRIAKTDGDGRNKRPDADQDTGKPAEGEFPDVDRCLVIIGGLEDECSKRLQKFGSARYVLPQVQLLSQDSPNNTNQVQ